MRTKSQRGAIVFGFSCAIKRPAYSPPFHIYLSFLTSVYSSFAFTRSHCHYMQWLELNI